MELQASAWQIYELSQQEQCSNVSSPIVVYRSKGGAQNGGKPAHLLLLLLGRPIVEDHSPSCLSGCTLAAGIYILDRHLSSATMITNMNVLTCAESAGICFSLVVSGATCKSSCGD